MEIIGTATLVIVSACIWAAWGPKVLLAAILIPLAVASTVFLYAVDTKHLVLPFGLLTMLAIGLYFGPKLFGPFPPRRNEDQN